MSDLQLPALNEQSTSILAAVTDALKFRRDILASDEEIERVWSELPRLLDKIPPEMRSPLHVRMCVAVASGLFDSAINYAWNSAILALRERVRLFGLNVVAQIKGGAFDERTLAEQKDAELLSLCVSLNLINEEGNFLLDQCREIRNNFSSAHPPVGQLDDAEFLVFLSRCSKYALTSTRNPRGVDTRAFIEAIKKARFTDDQLNEWVERLYQTHEAQRSLLFTTLYGIYCDPSANQDTRLNSLDVCAKVVADITPQTKSELIDRHAEYVAEGKSDRQRASQDFLKRIQLLGILTEQERHTLISQACKQLMSVHKDFGNFYNEPPFATRLYELAKQGAVPSTAQYEYVETVLACAIGNGYGVSRAAYATYQAIIRDFSPREIELMFQMLSNGNSIVGVRVQNHASCARNAKLIARLLDPQSIPTRSAQDYKKWVN